VRAFIELTTTGGRTMIVETATITGMIGAPFAGKMGEGREEKPLKLLIRNTDPVDVVGVSPVTLLAKICEVHSKAEEMSERQDAPPIAVLWLDHDYAEDRTE
jgi:hypothetical protein